MKNLDIDQIMCGNLLYEKSGMWVIGEGMGFSVNDIEVTEELCGKSENRIYFKYRIKC